MDKQVDFDSPHAVEADALFMSIGEGAIVTDSNGHISRVNKAALKILGVKEKELLGKWFPKAIVAEEENSKPVENIDRPISRSFLSGRPVEARTYYRRKDGSRVPVFLTVSPIMVRGKPVGAIEVFRDISYELSLEQAKDEFVAIASHQLRTPATAVKQYVGLLLEGYSDPLTEGQKMFLERAYENNERQLQIVQEILKVTQLDLQKVQLRPQRVDLRDVISDAVDGLRNHLSEKNQEITVILPSKPVRRTLDPDQLRIAIENLLENASNYSREHTTVCISLRELKDRVRITVKDEGVGIDAADIPKLFKKFSRIPNPLSIEVSGTGLGLYWAAKIVEMLGGYIHVNSQINKGSRFTINLTP